MQATLSGVTDTIRCASEIGTPRSSRRFSLPPSLSTAGSVSTGGTLQTAGDLQDTLSGAFSVFSIPSAASPGPAPLQPPALTASPTRLPPAPKQKLTESRSSDASPTRLPSPQRGVATGSPLQAPVSAAMTNNPTFDTVSPDSGNAAAAPTPVFRPSTQPGGLLSTEAASTPDFPGSRKVPSPDRSLLSHHHVRVTPVLGDSSGASSSSGAAPATVGSEHVAALKRRSQATADELGRLDDDSDEVTCGSPGRIPSSWCARYLPACVMSCSGAVARDAPWPDGHQQVVVPAFAVVQQLRHSPGG